MAALFASPWFWAVAAVLFGLAELVLPGAFLLWLGLAAGVTAILTAFVPLDPVWAALLFAFAALVSVPLGWLVMRPRVNAPDPARGLGDRLGALAGRVAVLEEPILRGEGRLKLDDTVWRVRGPDMVAGATVRVVGADANVLIVESA